MVRAKLWGQRTEKLREGYKKGEMALKGRDVISKFELKKFKLE